MKLLIATYFSLLVLLVGCQATTRSATDETPEPAAQTQEAVTANLAQPSPTYYSSTRPLAFVGGEPVIAADLMPYMVEASGGQVFSEIALEKVIDERLRQEGKVLRPARIAYEREQLLDNLSEDPDEAERLLKELRTRRGLGDLRFASLLRRNAGLRLLVQPDVTITKASLQQAFALKYGPTYQGRLIVVDSQFKARQIVERLAGGDSFADLAAEHSIDASKAQGGLLPPISPADTSYPQSIRDTLEKLPPKAVSQIIAIRSGFAILKQEKVTPGQDVVYEDVQSELSKATRLQYERILMQRLARSLVSASEVVVLDPPLKAGWEEQRAVLLAN